MKEVTVEQLENLMNYLRVHHWAEKIVYLKLDTAICTGYVIYITCSGERRGKRLDYLMKEMEEMKNAFAE